MNDTKASFLTDLSSVMPSFLGPKALYSDPTDILSAPGLSIAEKREILSSWASDARAVPNAPTLRTLENGQTVGIHDILDALKMLDAVELSTDGSDVEDDQPPVGHDPSRRWLPAVLRWRRRDDDDDDPPPCPAVIAPSPRFPTFGAAVEQEAA